MIHISYQAPSFHITYKEEKLGTIDTYSNPHHQTNTYLKLDLVDYSCAIAEQLFQSLQAYLNNKPLQVMLSSAEQEKIHFLTAAGFICKRKCYEFTVTKEDYRGQQVPVQLITAYKGSAAYQQAAHHLFQQYTAVHQAINPLTASQENFENELPDLAYVDPKNWKHSAFVENNEVAYICGQDSRNFDHFAQQVICQLFKNKHQIFFEADDCDPIAMRLAGLFQNKPKESWNTYILT